MRISVDESDTGFLPFDQRRSAQVFLNGSAIRECVTADEEAGEAICLKTDANGRLVIDHVADKVARETRRGTVRVFIPQMDAKRDGFDAWMRERTEAAHGAMMAHAAVGGIDFK
jgi:hypothetical protein